MCTKNLQKHWYNLQLFFVNYKNVFCKLLVIYNTFTKNTFCDFCKLLVIYNKFTKIDCACVCVLLFICKWFVDMCGYTYCKMRASFNKFINMGGLSSAICVWFKTTPQHLCIPISVHTCAQVRFPVTYRFSYQTCTWSCQVVLDNLLRTSCVCIVYRISVL